MANEILVGYFPKRRTPRFPWPPSEPRGADAEISSSETDDGICSVSRCVAGGPEGWRDAGGYNSYGMYETPDLAWSAVHRAARAGFRVFGYRLLLTQYLEGKEEPIEPWWELNVAPLPSSFVRLGWDAVVGGNQHAGFGCSPLSCNAGAHVVESARKNRYWLMDTEDEGIALARHFSICQPEPGPYCVVEVWRGPTVSS